MSSTVKTIWLAICGLVVGGAIFVCGPSASAQTNSVPPSGQCNVQPNGVITPQMAEGFRAFWPLYVRIATDEQVDAILIAPLHYREHFGRDNPANGQGIFQLYSLVKYQGAKFPGTHGQAVSDDEFVRQGKLAVDELKSKVKIPLGQTPDGGYVKAAYYGYNGRNRLYASQARPGQGPWDGSPYVMNIPGQRELIMMTHDGGRGPRRLDPRPGAWPIYEELRRQCVQGPLPPDAPPQVASPPVEAQTAGIDLMQLFRQPLTGGPTMQEFNINWQPIHMDGEACLILMAVLLAIAVGYFIHHGKWKRPDGLLVIVTLASFSLMFALMADHFGKSWSYDQIWQNVGAVVQAIGAWITYPPRVTAIKTALFGASLVSLIIFAVRWKTAGKAVFGETWRGIKPFFTGGLKLLRRIWSWRFFWACVASIAVLAVASTRLQGQSYMYGTMMTSLLGGSILVFIIKKSSTNTIEEG